jgi:hypothetical protein
MAPYPLAVQVKVVKNPQDRYSKGGTRCHLDTPPLLWHYMEEEANGGIEKGIA